MWDRHPIRLSLLHMLPQVADAHGLALAPLLDRAGITGALDGAGVVARGQVSTVLQEAARRAGEPTFGLALAAKADPVQLGPSGHALFAGRTLRECLAAQARHMPTLQGGVRLQLVEAEGRAWWHHRFDDADPAHSAVLSEGVAGFMVAALRALAAAPAGRIRVSLPHQARAPSRAYEDMLASDVSFGSNQGLVIGFDADWLDRPNPHFAACWPQVDGVPSAVMLQEGHDDAALLAALERIVAAAARAGSLSLVDAARSLGLSPRTLQRRLARLGTRFEVLVDQWRHQQARQHLAAGGLPVASIARLLGYSDPAHFIRAFRRWEGDAPQLWRRSQLAPNGN
ncbi:AraC family transcriptional regulator ligand-binding domain-containing protein [Ancylobacter sp. IITR112]|uniref:helix-turn-helix transcriptional regulator n=1 Tax=Ancylobacter sp. IITR112 TaxID=3138073 RepID=UPI00352BB829